MTKFFQLNEYNVHKNPFAGSHDPSMMFDPVSRQYYSYCTDTYGPAIGVEDLIGIPVRSSPDLVDFTYRGNTLSPEAIQTGRNNGTFPETRNFWAPYVEYARGEYRMYYSATRAFGSSESRIWLAVSQDPLGPFENRGVVADTWGTDDTFPNAIDPHIIWVGQQNYLVYGSFFGGIHIKQLDPATGLPADGNPKNFGTCISKKAKNPRLDGPEGAAVIYIPETGWYYLFQSYGWLGDGYDIRVGRSKQVTGPYVDRKGQCLVENALGEKLAGSYRFTATAPRAGNTPPNWEYGGFRGPGHGVPFFDPQRKSYFFVHHVRDGAMVNSYREQFDGRLSFRRHYMMIRPMFFIDGWPVLAPEVFSGEPLSPAAPIAGPWELIFHTDDNNEPKHGQLRSLAANDPLLTNGRLWKCRDYENGGWCLTVTGTTEDGVCYWGKLPVSDE